MDSGDLRGATDKTVVEQIQKEKETNNNNDSFVFGQDMHDKFVNSTCNRKHMKRMRQVIRFL